MKLNLPSLNLKTGKVGPKLWITLEPFGFMLDSRYMAIPNLFVTDKYSVPLGILFKRSRPVAMQNIPAILHDFLVRYRKTLGISLVDCHKLFLQAMKLCGIDPFTRACKYMAVMAFNWMIVGPGDGSTSGKVKRFIDRHGYGN